MSKGRVLVAYLGLVGIPLLILLAILRGGTHLPATPALRGAWDFEADSGAVAESPCGSILDLKHPGLEISQSGRDLTVVLNNPQRTSLAGLVNGSAVTADGMAAPDSSEASGVESGCTSPRPIHLDAKFSGSAGSRVIAGSLSLTGCSECRSLAFHAIPYKEQPSAAQASVPQVVTIVIQIAVIIIAVRALGFAIKFIGQPQVIGEMMAGILLGPSLLGWIAPQFSAVLFPPASLSYLNTISQLGIVMYMFLVGLELNPSELKGQGHAAVLTSHVSIIVPFMLGSILALFLYPRLSDDGVSLTTFTLFMGAAMSITAFPVLARILTDRRMLGSRLGTLAIACAAVDDVTGWCIVAYITLAIHVQSGTTPAWLTITGSIAFILLMVFGVRPLLRHLQTHFENRGWLGENGIALVLLLVLVSATATERLGIHLLFGAFLAGVIMPKNPAFSLHIVQKLQSLTVVLLLPLYFAYTGLRMNLKGLGGARIWLYCGIIIVVAIAGKLVGSMIAARVSGKSWRDATGLGILLNTRGLMGFVVLNIGLDLGVITPALFAMMVLMALVTTFMTCPLLEVVYPLKVIQEEAATLEKAHGAA